MHHLQHDSSEELKITEIKQEDNAKMAKQIDVFVRKIKNGSICTLLYDAHIQIHDSCSAFCLLKHIIQQHIILYYRVLSTFVVPV